MSPEPVDPFEKTRLDPASRPIDDASPEVRNAPTLPLQDSRSMPPPTFARYRLESELGRGGMGAVYRARDTDMNRVVALKVLLSGEFSSSDAERRFVLEAELAAQLNHPNIVAVYDIGLERGRRFYTMELVEGRPLGEWASFHPLAKRLKVLAKVCRAVHFAHMKGIIHRDLKPQNVLVTAQDEPKVLDFGLAKLTQPTDSSMKTHTGQTLGSPFYMAPEQAAGRVHDVDIRTDVWALGVILYELTARRVPFPGTDLFEILARIQEADPSPLDAAPDLRLIAAKAMEKDKTQRYATAEALAEDIERFLAGEPVSARPPSPAYLLRRWVRRHRPATAAALAALGMAGAWLAWALSRPGELAFEVVPAHAWIEVDGRRSQARVRVPAGRHDVRMGADGWETLVDDLDVRRGETRELAYRLARSQGLLTVEADVPGALVRIGDATHGLPLRDHPLNTGEYTLRIEALGHESRERTVRIHRGAATAAWVSLPSGEYRFTRFGNTFGGPVVLRDLNRDGVLDPGTWTETLLYSMDGRSGARVRQTSFETVVCRPTWATIDWDGDGILDDAVLTRIGEKATVRVIGSEAGAPVTGGRAAPQKLLWEWQFPTPPGENWWGFLAAIPGELWIPTPGGARVYAAGGSAVLGDFTFGGDSPPQLREFIDGSGMMVATGASVKRFARGARELWSVDLDGASLLDENFVVSRFDPARVIPVSAKGFIYALRPEDGSVVWKEKLKDGEKLTFIPHGMSATFTEIFFSGPEGTGALDAETGRRLFERVRLDDRQWYRFCAAPGIFFYPDVDRITARSARTGGVLWSRPISAPVSGWPAAAVSSRGVEVAFPLEDRRLVVFDAAGRVARDIPLEFVTHRVHACELDADGLTDYVLVGFGLQAIRSSRIFWRRSGSNTMRPRPAVLDVAGRACVVEISRWEDGRGAMRCFRGDTGEILWSVADDYDVMHEPALADFDGDGTKDVWTQKGAAAKFTIVSGTDGRTLAEAPIPSTPYPPVVPRDLDGDGRLEYAGFFWATGFEARRPGEEKPIWSVPTGAVFSIPLLIDADADGKDDLVAALAASGPEDAAIGAWSFEGRALWTCPVPDPTWGAPFAHDVDGDGRTEIVVPGLRDLHVVDRSGKLLRTLPGLGGSHFPPARLPDGSLVLGTGGGCVRLRPDLSSSWFYRAARVSGAVGVAGSSAVGVDWNGRFFCLDLESGAERWRLETGARCEHGVALADLDADGTPEALFGSDDFTIYAIDLR